MDFRRDVGIWARIVGLFHVVVGQCAHLRGRPWLYYIYENWRTKHVLPVRHDLFGLAKRLGLLPSRPNVRVASGTCAIGKNRGIEPSCDGWGTRIRT